MIKFQDRERGVIWEDDLEAVRYQLLTQYLLGGYEAVVPESLKDTKGITLVDARNVFSNFSRLVIICTVWHHCLVRAILYFN